MAHIENAKMSITEFRTQLANMPKSEILAQQLVQKGAIHALEHLLREGCTEALCRKMLASAKQLGACIDDENRKRGLPLVQTETQEEA
jgi:hypothetical protein